jgi:hypothetical protein
MICISGSEITPNFLAKESPNDLDIASPGKSIPFAHTL